MYAVFFEYDITTYRLPVNPEEIKVTSSQAIKKFETLSLGQIAIPTHMELSGYSFDCELPKEQYSYVEAMNNFKNAMEYINIFQKWRNDLVPVRFIAGRGSQKDEMYVDCINTLVLFEDITITEKAGEEGDKYISFKLIEYKDFKRRVKEMNATGKISKKATEEKSPKSNGTYVVKSGDSLWAIAKKYYGDGAKYTKIYNANKDNIKNPSLIYPGQKLVIP